MSLYNNIDNKRRFLFAISRFLHELEKIETDTNPDWRNDWWFIHLLGLIKYAKRILNLDKQL